MAHSVVCLLSWVCGFSFCWDPVLVRGVVGVEELAVMCFDELVREVLVGSGLTAACTHSDP